jgi:hypothetical protein
MFFRKKDAIEPVSAAYVEQTLSASQIDMLHGTLYSAEQGCYCEFLDKLGSPIVVANDLVGRALFYKALKQFAGLIFLKPFSAEVSQAILSQVLSSYRGALVRPRFPIALCTFHESSSRQRLK